MNKRLRPKALLALVRKVARQNQRTVVAEPGRGKESHRLYRLLDQDGLEIGRFAMPDHARALSWTVLRSIENAFAQEFGERWMEEK
ncbi:hypothetical protein [Actinokineospora iranica]|uniref:hypothetical protein n=1 Tax=Actinokineospora iranica TaxID=1271860 RepID=UPI001E5A535C|nr:hypothetical protein [Actinokineospora iranica]